MDGDHFLLSAKFSEHSPAPRRGPAVAGGVLGTGLSLLVSNVSGVIYPLTFCVYFVTVHGRVFVESAALAGGLGLEVVTLSLTVSISVDPVPASQHTALGAVRKRA